MKIEIKTAFEEGLIDQRMIEHPLLGPSHEVARMVINLRDKGVREALMALGWTPPDPVDQAEKAR